MNKRVNMKKAFSLIELIFVIVVLGIVASIGADTIAQVFKNTIPQKATNIAAIKTELATQQLANRLSYAVPWSIVAKNINGSTPQQLGDVAANDMNDKVIEWIGVDGDSFEATATPGWSGYCDAPNSTATNCSTPGSALANTDTVIKNLGGAGITDAIAIFDRYKELEGCNLAGDQYSGSTVGLIGTGTQCAFPLTSTGGGTNLTFANVPKRRAEIYSLAWSAYALVPINERNIGGGGGQKVFDLELRYGYQPWKGDTFDAVPLTQRQTIATNVSVFKVSQNSIAQDDIRLKICVKQPIGTGSTDFISMCKEKAVTR
jgi:prepilin-type N-terminal cleavage/methylation domain-containing protein